MKSLSRGFTFIELIVIMGIIAMLFGIISISLLNATRHTTLSADIDILISDFKQQQTDAMSGLGQDSNYGLYLTNNSHFLFKGTSYNPGDTNNFPVTLTSTNQITNPQTIIFTAGSGDTTAGSIILRNTVSGEQKIIQFNRHGVITSIN